MAEVAGYSPMAKIPSPCALQASLQIFGRGNRTNAPCGAWSKSNATPAGERKKAQGLRGSRVFAYGENSRACHRLASGRCSARRNRTNAPFGAWSKQIATPASTKAALSDGFRLAGVAGFEPTMEESKSSALTTRRYPLIYNENYFTTNKRKCQD